MALRTVGTHTPYQLACLTNWSQIIPAADLAAIGSAICSDAGFGIMIQGPPGLPGHMTASYVLATGATSGLDVLTGVTQIGVVGYPPVSAIQPGDLVLGRAVDIVPGTCVVRVMAGGASIILSQPTASSGDPSAPLVFLRQNGVTGISNEAQLWVPGRGTLNVLPGDIVAVDSSGWPILISGNSVAYGGTDWQLA